MSDEESRTSKRGQSLGAVFQSVAASMFGVQSSKKHKEDFAKGSIGSYMMVGAIMTVVFVLSVWGIVKLVMSIAIPEQSFT